MNEVVANENIEIEDIIYEIRGNQVMLDRDLAKLYQVETKRINEAVKNNPLKFPDRFSRQLTDDEQTILRSKISTSSINTYGGLRYNSRVFTEQGVAMLATILKSKVATDVSIRIMDTFVKIRAFIYENRNIFKRIIEIENDTSYIKDTLLEYGKNFEIIFNKFEHKEDLKSKLFFNGGIYDAYSLLVDIIKGANNKIIIVDNYIDKVTLDILSKKNINVEILLVTDERKSKLTKTDIDKFNKEYPTLNVKYANIFHDRFIIVDNEKLYHLGASLKDLGKKVFGINKIEDKMYLQYLKEKTDEIK